MIRNNLSEEVILVEICITNRNRPVEGLGEEALKTASGMVLN